MHTPLRRHPTACTARDRCKTIQDSGDRVSIRARWVGSSLLLPPISLLILAMVGWAPFAGPLAAQIPSLEKAVELYVAGDLSGAKTAAKRVVEREPENPLAFVILGTIAVREQDFPTAEKHLLRATSLDPNLIGAHLTLGQVYLQRGNGEQAARIYRKVLELDSENVYALRALAAFEQARGRLAEAERLLERFRAGDPNDIAVLLELARIANLQGGSEKALSLLLNAKKVNPENFGSYTPSASCASRWI